MNETAAYEALAEQLYELERERDERQERAAVILDAWAEAIRMDWGSIDGRSCRAQLEEISAFLRGTKDTLTFDDVCVCRCNGTTHWHGDLWGEMCPDVASEGAPDA